VIVTFLGTGTSQGVPVIACDARCAHQPMRKIIACAHRYYAGRRRQGDCDRFRPDFRYQMLRAKVKHLDAIVFTHEHKDHVAGLDDIRAFNYRQKLLLMFMQMYVYKSIKKRILVHF
jgi:phosphoribosyl 1,2-cyclic phosphate phosphodiesterase